MKIQLSTEKIRAFTLVEIMVVVIIIAVLAATIIPKFIGTANDAKIASAKSQVSELEAAVERFYVHMDRYPTTDEGLNVLVNPPAGDDSKQWRGPYIKQVINDPWGNPYQYANPGTHHPTSYDIWSQGKDGAEIGNW